MKPFISSYLTLDNINEQDLLRVIFVLLFIFEIQYVEDWAHYPDHYIVNSVVIERNQIKYIGQLKQKLTPT